MTAKTSTFSFAGLELRCVTIDGEPWFVAADVCAFTLHGNVTMALRSLDAAEKAQFNLGHRPTNLISEAGLYRLVMRARKRNPALKEFQDFVTGTVLPTIRKTGGYIQGEEKLATGEMTDEQFFALAVLKANTTIELMKAKNAEQRVEIERQAKIIREELEHGTIREFSSKAGMYLRHGQSVRMGQLAAGYCRANGLEIHSKLMWKDGRQVPVNIYPKEAFEHARLMLM